MNTELSLPRRQEIEAFKINVTKPSSIKGERCLIINPGLIAQELIKEPKFKERYYVDFWDSTNGIDLATFISSQRYDVVLLDPSFERALTNSQLKHINDLRVNQISVYNLASFYENYSKRIPSVHCKSWLINSDLFYVSSRSNYFHLKRVVDLLIAISISPIAFLLVLAAVISIKLTSEGPAFFIQNRVGMRGKSFRMFKLRTMYYRPDCANTGYTVVNDKRITAVGRVLRKTKIDELPQLYNIICGHMSLIGPRPEKEDIVFKLVEEAPYYNLRHSIRPGVTGWAQVTYPTATPEENLQKLEYDLYYVKNASLTLDLKIMLKTIKVVATMNSL